MKRNLMFRKSTGSGHRAHIGRYVLIFLLTAGILTMVLADSYAANMNKGLSDNLVRLHVIANSDSPEDQQLKRDVRDAILAYMHGELENSENIQETKAIVSDRLDEITNIAEKTIAEKGKAYSVKAMLGSYPFPTKSYGDIVLPAGNYQALRVVIGDGAGANWWCVLFPPLCFVDVTHGTIPESAKEELRAALTEDEYGIIASADEEADIPIKIKFKIVEIFQDSKLKIASAFSRLLSNP
jgi:stage II sporulation protein R